MFFLTMLQKCKNLVDNKKYKNRRKIVFSTRYRIQKNIHTNYEPKIKE